jgi:hypothetical protein
MQSSKIYSKLKLMPLDVGYLLSPLLIKLHPSFGLFMLIGLSGLIISAIKIGKLHFNEEFDPPYWWFVLTLFLPWTVGQLIKDGYWMDRTPHMKHEYSIGATALISIAIILLLTGIYKSVFNPIIKPLDDYGDDYLIESQIQAGLTYGASRLINT